jgi:hypothetical protein
VEGKTRRASGRPLPLEMNLNWRLCGEKYCESKVKSNESFPQPQRPPFLQHHLPM